MVAKKLDLLLFFTILYCVTDCERRIHQGKVVSVDKRYVVYLVKAPVKEFKLYDEWMCGGALVTTWFVITSAACVTDVEYLYVIAGYRKHARNRTIETDSCTKTMRKKVVYTCVPKNYNFAEGVVNWSFLDIALVKVESEYDLYDKKYKTVCSYTPTLIPINYEPKFTTAGTDCVVFGWGHEQHWRGSNDHAWSYNREDMHYAATKIMDKNTCKEHYDVESKMTNIIENFMICTYEEGEINDKGEFALIGPPILVEGCSTQSDKKASYLDSSNCNANRYDLLVDYTRRRAKNSNRTSSDSSQNQTLYNSTAYSRRHGICQNDHGGPLVTWMGGREILIGVASVFKVSMDNKCMGPFLFTSTVCNGFFIDCVLNDFGKDNRRMAALCNSPPIQRGFDIIERRISWKEHPAGPADNERK